MTSRTFLLLSLMIVGCGGKSVGDDSNTTDSGTSTGDSATIPEDGNIPIATDAGTVDYCKASADRAARCGGSFSLTECQEQLACYRRALRPEAYTPLLTCFATRECGTSDDRCVAQESQKYISDPVVSDWVKSCNEKRSACMGGFSDDYCGYEFGIMTDALRASLKTCIAKPCAEIRTCFDTTFAALGCNN